MLLGSSNSNTCLCAVWNVLCPTTGPLWASSWAGLANVGLLMSPSLWCTAHFVMQHCTACWTIHFVMRFWCIVWCTVLQCNLQFVHWKQVTGKNVGNISYVYYNPLRQSLPSVPLCQFVFIEIKALEPICCDLSNLSRLSALSSFSSFQSRVHSASHPHALISGI